MGDDPPDQRDVVCPSCEAELHRESDDRQRESVTCPECGESVPLDGAGADSGGEADPRAPKAQVMRQRDDESDGTADETDREAAIADLPGDGNDLDTGRTLMGVGARAVDPDDDDAEDEEDTGGGTPIAQIRTKKERRSAREQSEDASAPEGSAQEGDEASAETAMPDVTDTGEDDAPPERAFDAVTGEDDDVHGRETSVTQKPLSELTNGGGGDEEPETLDRSGDDSDGEGKSRLSALKERLQDARGRSKSNEDDGDDANPFKNGHGTLGEETQAARDPGFDEDDEDFADAAAEEAVEVTVADEEAGDETSDPNTSTPPVPETNEKSFEWEQNAGEVDSEVESRSTKPSGEDKPLEELPNDLSSISEQMEVEEEVASAESDLPDDAGATLEDVPEPTTITEAPDLEETSSPGEASSEEADGDNSDLDEIEREVADEAAGVVGDLKDVGELGENEVEQLGQELGDDASDLIRNLRDEEGLDENKMEQLGQQLGDEASDLIQSLKVDGGLEASEKADEAESGDQAPDNLPPIPDPGDASDASESGSDATLEDDASIPGPSDISDASDETLERDSSIPGPSDISDASDSGSDASLERNSSVPRPDEVDTTRESSPPVEKVAEADGDSPPPADEIATAGSSDDTIATPEDTGPAPADGGQPMAEADDASGSGELPEPAEKSDVDFPPPDDESASDIEAEPSDEGQPSPATEPSEAEGGPVDREGSTGSSAGWGAAIAGGLLLVAGLVIVTVDPIGLFSDETEGGSTSGGESGAETAEGDETAEEDETVTEVIEAASQTLHEKTEVDVSDPDLQRGVADRLAEAGRTASASRIYDVLWTSTDGSTEIAGRYLDLLMEAERYDRARQVAVEAMGVADDPSEYERRFEKAIAEDQALQGWEPIELGERAAYADLRLARDVDFSGLVITGPDGAPKALFAPAEKSDGGADEREWRDDVAAWRLCEVIACQFEVPRTRPARISKAAFDERFDDGEGDDRQGLRWVERSGETYLYGALREWPGEVVRWPIEEYGVWRPWLSAQEDPALLDGSADQAMKPFEKLGDGSLYRAAAREAGDRPVGEFARQLSGVIAFDFLTNNWDRFESDEARYGANLHLRGGQLVTMRTETVLQRRKSTRVKGRFRWISRFSRSMVRTVRLLDQKRARGILYPEASALEKRKFDIFWDQREALLDRVDTLSDDHGREAVLAFP